MSPPLFWADSVPAPGADLILSGPEGRHAVTVARLGVGERILVGDGAGSVGGCEIREFTAKDTLVATVHDLAFEARPTPQVTVVQALPKSERSELAVDLATEAEVTLDKQPDGFAITAVRLTLKAKIPGIDDAKFQELAAKAKAGCPVSKLLKAEISLDASLA